ncbi:phosphate ABC transporter substrate-binding protein PstS [Acidipropionibacterium virtanenii]|uniref:Phosphate-binding protein n=1 Tax=Acidipropionibacterium virtanenii TaxID=2057246 RepID=A0A344URM9_9ACTN|nr:phosphate ABC transporter substrate-binding protein PstS [Acidipropionibacterium virtanenii]AXE37927.1 Phosphate-binding protein PstS3 [Acidipropionibacterium virtanenii]
MKTTRLATLTTVALLGALGLSACGSSETGSSASTAASTAKATSTVAAAAPSPTDYTPTCPGGTINGGGSSAQANAITQVINDYKKACGSSKVNYSITGSGAGVSAFLGKQIDWAGSDSALSADKGEISKAAQRCSASEAWHLPMAAGPIAVVVNLDGVKELNLSSQTLAGIFSGEILKWNDAAIKKENPSAKLPSTDISVFYRSDESGTTDNFTNYLNKAAGDVWTEKHSKQWKGTGKGADKSAGVAQAVKSTKNSISYVEWSYAEKNDLTTVAIDNGNGPVKLSGESAGKAVSAAKSAGAGNNLQLEMQYKDTPAGVYPAVLVTYEIVCSKGLDAQKTALLKDFMSFYASDAEQKAITAAGYAPLPGEVAGKVIAAAQAIA